MLSERGTHATRNSTSTSMVINLRKWLEVMDAYENGGFAYYTTMPTVGSTGYIPFSHKTHSINTSFL